jgi:hypothetical protein
MAIVAELKQRGTVVGEDTSYEPGPFPFIYPSCPKVAPPVLNYAFSSAVDSRPSTRFLSGKRPKCSISWQCCFANFPKYSINGHHAGGTASVISSESRTDARWFSTDSLC